MNSCYLHCARSIHINTDRKQLKQVFHFRFSFEPRFSEVDKSLFLAPPLRTTSCNVHYSGSILYDNERETWSKSRLMGGVKSLSFPKIKPWSTELTAFAKSIDNICLDVNVKVSSNLMQNVCVLKNLKPCCFREILR